MYPIKVVYDSHLLKLFPVKARRMTKRASKENARQRKRSEDMTGGDSPPPKKPRYPLRSRKNAKAPPPEDDETLWVDDDTLDNSQEVEQILIEIQVHQNSDSEYDPDSDEFLNILKSKFSHESPSMFPAEPAAKKRKVTKKDTEKISMELSKSERKYLNSLDAARRKDVLASMNRVSELSEEGEVPYKFKILCMPISDYMKSMVLKKLDALAEMNMDSGGAYKLKTWVDGFLKIPFGKSVPLPVKIEDGIPKCTEFMVDARKQLDKHIYGMKTAKTQIMQVLSQWVVNPTAVGNVIALHGPMGVGKTVFARNGIASVLQRPFGFFTLGGASDVANFTGHSYTYEGSTWGRIADTMMQCGTMNPVLYFDELDKISGTAHGEEIASMLIHLTDRSQNTEFHDRYFSGVDFDMSQCLFVFSFNDIEKVHPILRDRMNIIECGGYDENDKKEILKNYVWPEMVERLKFKTDDLVFEDDAMKFVISEYSETEKGVRNLIRAMETVITRINMLRVSNHESMKEYPFYMEVKFPLKITPKVIQTMMKDTSKTKQEDVWKMMYT